MFSNVLLTYRTVVLYDNDQLSKFGCRVVFMGSAPIGLEETTGTYSYFMDENHSAGSEIQRPQYGRHS